MKIIYLTFRNLTILSFLMVISGAATAQVSVTSGDMPSPGDTIRKSNAFTTAGIDYTLTGENYIWDFTPLSPLYQTVDTFVSVNSVPFLYQLVFIPNFVANLAQQYGEIDTLGIPVTDPYRFFKNTSSSFTNVGFAVTINDIPIPLKFDNADVVYDFPVEYGNEDASSSGVEFGIPDLGFISIQRQRENVVDGWGTLSTSFGTFDVVRLRSTVQETDSIYIDSLSFGQALDRNYTEYKWLAPGYKAPLLQVTEEGPLLTVAWMDSVFDPTTAVHDPDIANTDMEIYPNPINNDGKIVIRQENSGPVDIGIFNLTGVEVQKLYSGYLSSGEHHIAFSCRNYNLAGGIYFIRMQSGEGTVTKKLVVKE